MSWICFHLWAVAFWYEQTFYKKMNSATLICTTSLFMKNPSVLFVINRSNRSLGEFQSCYPQHHWTSHFSTSWWGCDQMWSPGTNYVYCFIFNALIFALCRHIHVKSINIIWHNITYKLVCVSLAVLFSSKGHINWTARVQCKPRRKSIMRHHLNIKISSTADTIQRCQ